MKFLRKAAALLCILFMMASPLLANAEYAAYKGRDGFLFGVNGHNRSYEAYPEKNLEQQVRLAAEMGSKVYRFNFVPMSLNDFDYLDKVYRTVHAYGMELLLVMEGSHDEYEDIRDHAKMVAKRYAGKINYIQVGNERDIPAMLGASVDGTQKAHYNMSALAASVNQLKAMCEGVREGSPSTKIIINFSYKHTYYLDYLHEQKVDFDIIGWDWYSNMGEYEPTMEKILSFGKEMMVCETNLWDGRDADAETTRSQWLKEFADFIYNYDSPLVKGFIVYELLDEPAMSSDGDTGNEGHYGLVNNSRSGDIGKPKQAYYDLQKWWGGKAMPNVVVPGEATEAPAKTTTTAKKTAAPTTTAVKTTEASQTTTTAGTETTLQATSEATTASTAATSAGASTTAAAPSEKEEGGLPVWPFVVGGIVVVLLAAGGVFLWLWKAGKLPWLNK